jgi:CheY-like chemotaxis protein
MEKRILLVEDDASFREVFTHALREALAPEQLDVTFVEAGTLAEARTRLREGGLDAALIDVTMPDGNGLELVGEIHDGGVGSPIPTLVLTASLETSVADRAIEQGARGALSKLASMPETVVAIKRLTDAYRSSA